MSEQMTDAEYHAWVRKLFETAQRTSMQRELPVHELSWNGCITLHRDGTLVLDGTPYQPERAQRFICGLAWMFKLAERAQA